MNDQIRVYVVEGEQSFTQAVAAVDQLLGQAVAEGVRRVLVDVRGLRGFAKPDVAERAWMVRRWAATTQGRLKLAVVSPPELNDGERFDVVFAQANGLDGDVFEDEAEARDWLEQLPETWRGPQAGF